MRQWKECTLGDAITLQRGHDLPKTKMKEGIYPVAGSNGIIGAGTTVLKDVPDGHRVVGVYK